MLGILAGFVWGIFDDGCDNGDSKTMNDAVDAPTLSFPVMAHEKDKTVQGPACIPARMTKRTIPLPPHVVTATRVIQGNAHVSILRCALCRAETCGHNSPENPYPTQIWGVKISPPKFRK